MGDAHVIAGTAGTAAVKVMVKNRQGKECLARGGVFRNEHATQTLSISFDDVNYTLVPAAGAYPLTVTGTFNAFFVKASGATTPYSVTLTLGG